MAVLEEHGYFWWSTVAVPDGHFAPANAVPGYLEIADDGVARLELHGFLSEKPNPFVELMSPDPLDEKAIQGILKASSSHVLLFNLDSDGGRASFDGISHQNFRAWRTLVGSKRIEYMSGLFFSGFSVGLDGFEEWLGVGGISSVRTNRSLKVKANISKVHKYALRDSNVKLSFGVKSPWGKRNGLRKLTVEEYAELEYAFKCDVDLSSIQRRIHTVSSLLVLFSGSSRSLEWPKVYIGRGSSRAKYSYYSGSTRLQSRPIKPFDCWVRFPQISEALGSLLESWDDAQIELGSGLQFLIGTLMSSSLHLEHRFANLVWGMEVLHRLKNPEAEQSDALTEKIKRIISDVKLSRDRAWLAKRLRNAHEPSLQQRLKESLLLLDILVDDESLTEFCKVCADLRNDLSHFGGQRTFPSYTDMINALQSKTIALEFLYHAVALREIGVDINIIKKFIFGRNSSKYSAIASAADLKLKTPHLP